MKTTAELGRSLTTLLLVLMVASVIFGLTGCSKKNIENPYEQATLAEAISGESEYKLFKFELNKPEILAVGSKLALLTDGERIEFLVADDITALTTLTSDYRLGVHRDWGSTPEIYLVLDHYIDGSDTSFVTSDEPPVFPSYRNFAAFDKSQYTDLHQDLGGMSDKDASSLLKTYGKQGSKTLLEGTLDRGEINGQMEYSLETSLGKFQLVGVTGLGEIFLKAVLKGSSKITVLGSLGEIHRRSEQRRTGIKAPLTLEYFQFQSYMITNG
jgi:hypothetical protein